MRGTGREDRNAGRGNLGGEEGSHGDRHSTREGLGVRYEVAENVAVKNGRERRQLGVVVVVVLGGGGGGGGAEGHTLRAAATLTTTSSRRTSWET